MPVAVTTKDDIWKHVDMTPQKLRELAINMRTKVSSQNYTYFLHGFALFDDKGKQIRIWYSILTATTSLKMKDDHTVIIITPDIDTYLRYGWH